MHSERVGSSARIPLLSIGHSDDDSFYDEGDLEGKPEDDIDLLPDRYYRNSCHCQEMGTASNTLKQQHLQINEITSRLFNAFSSQFLHSASYRSPDNLEFKTISGELLRWQKSLLELQVKIKRNIVVKKFLESQRLLYLDSYGKKLSFHQMGQLIEFGSGKYRHTFTVLVRAARDEIPKESELKSSVKELEESCEERIVYDEELVDISRKLLTRAKFRIYDIRCAIYQTIMNVVERLAAENFSFFQRIFEPEKPVPYQRKRLERVVSLPAPIEGKMLWHILKYLEVAAPGNKPLSFVRMTSYLQSQAVKITGIKRTGRPSKQERLFSCADIEYQVKERVFPRAEEGFYYTVESSEEELLFIPKEPMVMERVGEHPLMRSCFHCDEVEGRWAVVQRLYPLEEFQWKSIDALDPGDEPYIGMIAALITRCIEEDQVPDSISAAHLGLSKPHHFVQRDDKGKEAAVELLSISAEFSSPFNLEAVEKGLAKITNCKPFLSKEIAKLTGTDNEDLFIRASRMALEGTPSSDLPKGLRNAVKTVSDEVKKFKELCVQELMLKYRAYENDIQRVIKELLLEMCRKKAEKGYPFFPFPDPSWKRELIAKVGRKIEQLNYTSELLPGNYGEER